MNILRFLILALALAAIAADTHAIVALREPITVTQPDGSALTIKKTGDEVLSFTTTADGIILHESKGLYTYGTVASDGTVHSTGIAAADADTRAVVPSQGLTRLSDIDLTAIEATPAIALRRAQTVINPQQDADTRRSPHSGVGLMFSSFPNRGNVKGLVILVEYSDVKFTIDNPSQYYNDMMNRPGFDQYGGTGSALDYFTENSSGVFVPDFDVYGPVTLPHERAYYGEETGTTKDIRAFKMAVDACSILDDSVDFSLYDTDGDNEIDNVYIFYAGQGQASYGPSESVWPHAWYVRDGAGMNCRYDGKILNRYACSNEWERTRPDGVGTFIHEFSHVMGLPDLYATAGEWLWCTPGSWSCMDYGPYNNDGRTPPNYSAFERNALGWTEPINLDAEPATITLGDITSNRCAIIPTENPSEFFLLENRQRTGWDAFLPGHGMLIWHIDYNSRIFASNNVNNAAEHQYVDIVEAGGKADSGNSTTMATYPFPGTKKVTSFTATTTPALVSWNGRKIDVPITDITEHNGLITFKSKGGETPLAVPVTDVPVTDGTSYFIASWQPVAGATDYLLTVEACRSDAIPFADKADFGAGNISQAVLPDGWESSIIPAPTYTNINNSVTTPSLKMWVDGQTITSAKYDTDISSVSFWHRGQTTPSKMTSKILLSGLSGNEWLPLGHISPAGLEAKTFVCSDIPCGVRQIQLKLILDEGAVAVDDITVSGGDKAVAVGDYTDKPTGGKTQIRIDTLVPGYDTYRYTVRAQNLHQTTDPCPPVTVVLPGSNGVDNVSADLDGDTTPRYFNLNGTEVSNPRTGMVVIERRGAKTRKIIAL